MSPPPSAPRKVEAPPSEDPSPSAGGPPLETEVRGGRTRAALLPILFAALALAHLPLFTGEIVFFRDTAFWNQPARAFLRDALLGGGEWAWNPMVGLGVPVAANPLYGFFYPPNWLFLLVGPSGVARMLSWQSFAHLLWGSAGVVLVARRLGVGAPAALVGGLAWGLSGYTTSQWTAGLLLLADAWVPWVAVGFLALARALAERRGGWPLGVVKAALPVGMSLLLGEVFVALMGIAFGLATAALGAYAAPAGPGRAPARALAPAALGALAIGVALGGVVVLPARALVAGTDRAGGLPAAVAEMCSLHPLRALELVAPGSMGDPYGRYPAGSIVGEPRIDGLPLSYGVYLGASVVALALAALGRRRGLALALLALALVALLVTLGKHTPVHGLLRRLVPPLASMRYPEKYFVLVVGWTALLAALGAERLLAGAGPRPWRRIAGLVALLLGVGLLATRLFPADWAPLVRTGALEGALAVRRDFGERPEPPRVHRADRVDDAVRRFVHAPSPGHASIRSMHTLVHNLVTVFGIATVPGYDAAIPAPLSLFWTRNLKQGQQVLRALGIDYVVLPVDDPASPDRRKGLEAMMDPMPGARLYRVPGALPRVFLAGRADVVADAEALEDVLDDDVVAGGRVLLAPGAGAAPLGGAARRAGDCRIRRYTNTRIEAECSAQAPAVAVFVEQHDDRWRVEVDGAPAPLLRANLLLRGVALTPGRHRITLAYAPPLTAGAASTLAALAALVGLLAAARALRGRSGRF